MRSKLFILETNSSVSSLPYWIAKMQNLRRLRITRTPSLKTLLDEIGDLINLKELTLHPRCCNIISLPPSSIGKLTNLTTLDLSCADSQNKDSTR